LSKFIRLSVGTAAVLGLVQCKLDAQLTTAYTMTFTKSRCSANCAFCAQARESSAKASQLSRVTWPAYPLTQFIETITQNGNTFPFNRLCIQTICYPTLVKDLKYLVTLFKNYLPTIPLSLALPPLRTNDFQDFYNLGVDRVAVSLDTITTELFEHYKGSEMGGPFSWSTHYQALESARAIFGPNHTTTHLIIGLGETEFQTVFLLQDLVNKDITVGLFPFTPISGTSLENKARPALDHYRRLVTAQQMQFNSSNQLTNLGLSKERLIDIIARGKAFQTAGCPSCNRPFYTEQPGGPLFNYPYPPNEEAIKEIEAQLAGVL
jgi:biotin synthase-related radical SAM superfamily protein